MRIEADPEPATKIRIGIGNLRMTLWAFSKLGLLPSLFALIVEPSLFSSLLIILNMCLDGRVYFLALLH